MTFIKATAIGGGMAIAAGLCAHGSHGYEHNQVLVPWVRHVRTTKGGGGAIGLGQQWHRGARGKCKRDGEAAA